MKKIVYSLMLMLLFVLTRPAQAGFMDKLNSATQKLNEKSQQMQQGTWKPGKKQPAESGAEEDEDRPLNLKGQGHCKGQNSATCMDYMEVVGQCTDPLKGYRAKLTADLIEKKLKEDTSLSPELRKNLEEDLAGLREAQKNKSDSPTIAGEKNSQRHLMDITEDDQIAINADFGKFYQKIMNKCMGADHMGTGKRTEMNYVQDNSEAMNDRKKQEKTFSDMQACMAKTQGLRMTLTAERLEKNLKAANVSGKQKEDWEKDIAALREAGEKNLMMPAAVDPANPMRYATRLTMDDQVAINEEYSTQSMAIIEGCSATADKQAKSKPKDMTKSGGLVDHSKSPANHAAQKTAAKKKPNDGKWRVQKNRGALSCYLGACELDGMRDLTDCQKQTGGYWWKVLADGIQAKLDADKGTLTEVQKTEMKEDIDALRTADAERLSKYPAPDPERSMRYQDHFTKKEFGEAQLKYQKMYKAQMDYCNKTYADILKHN